MTELSVSSPMAGTQSIDDNTAGAFGLISPVALFNTIVQLDGTGKLPAVNGENVKNILVTQSVNMLATAGGSIVPLMVAPYALTVNRVILLPGTTTTGSDSSNYWAVNVNNSGDTLRSANKSTEGDEFVSFTPWDIGVNQNLNLVADNVLKGQIYPPAGSPTGIADSSFTWIVEYYKSA